jgi:MFS family permease
MPDDPSIPPSPARPSMWRSLAHRNYRLFFVGQGVSLIGTWMTRIATSWLVFRLAGSDSAAVLLGVVSFAGQIPTFILAPVAGVLVDRWNRHRVVVVTQVLSLVQSAMLAVVAFENQPGPTTILLILFLSIMQGLINAFDMPGRQAFMVEMIERKDDLPNAIALNSSLVNGGRLIGPSLAGIVIALVGEGWCFVIDAVSYVAVIIALLAMHVRPRTTVLRPPPMLHGLLEGFRYAFGFAPIRAVLLLLALVSFTAMPYTVLLPLFASDILQGGAAVLGFLSAASGVGALVGALHLARRNSVLGLGRVIVWAGSLFGLSLIGFAFSRWLGLSLVCLFGTGLGMMVLMAASNTILQTIVEEDKRGRVMSFYSMAFMGMAPFGSLAAGALAGWIGPSLTVLIGGAVSLTGAAIFAARLPHIRRSGRSRYVELGILPEVAMGIQSATELPRTRPV